ncbi:MAG: tRNA preQ1(34) S-adenosylmethionine ribosyltransferase-isomerase QueA [Gemmatimonadales bacterium]|nr:MAG: tRNA preQ1(34) S-adenosylmethionine ribosyltransferase-isomerase QueA [Gemmatimonadales bacterium]
MAEPQGTAEPRGAAGEPGAGTVPDLARTDAYDYELPEGRIARYPVDRRDESRLLVVPREGDSSDGSSFAHRRFRDLPGLMAPGDLLVLNESRVLPLRLLGRKPTGARGEVLLLRPLNEGRRRWEALVRPGSKLKPGRTLEIGEQLAVRIVEGLPDGGRVVELETPLEVEEALERFGQLPLPPYLEREAELLDRERYQTVYARVPGSVAAPTAGLHLTPELLATLETGGVEVARITLHVGPGTFRPVEADRIDAHAMHSEWWEVPRAAADAVARTRRRGGRVWAVGTTVVRTLESAAAPDGSLAPGGGETRLFISPGYRFKVVDGLITNFHLPRSTLLMLVAALAGYETTMAAYREAIREPYRFYSYGDAMAILPRRRASAPENRL